MNHRQYDGSRTRSRRPSTATSSNNNSNNNHNQHDTPTVVVAPLTTAAAPLVPGPYVPPPTLRHLLSPRIYIHPDDEPDHILAITFAILLRASNRAMSVKELGEAAYIQGYLRTRSVHVILIILLLFPYYSLLFPYYSPPLT